MLKSQRAMHVLLTLLLDVAALFLAFVAAWELRDSLGNILSGIAGMFGHSLRPMVRNTQESSQFYRILLSPNPLIGFKTHLLLFYLTVPAWLFFLNAQGGYDAQQVRGKRKTFAQCAYAGLLGSAAFLVLLFLIKFQISRLLIVNYTLLGIGFLWIGRQLVLPALQRRGRHPIRNLLVIGNRAAATRFAGFLKTPAYQWTNLLGFISDENEDASTRTDDLTTKTPLTRLGKLDDIVTLLDTQVVDEVVLVRSSSRENGSVASPQKWGDILELCLQRGRTVSLVDDMIPPVGARMEATMVGTLPTLVLHNTPQNTLGLVLKNALDRAAAFIAILLFSLPMAIIALLIKLHDGGPILFKQKRVGLNGRQFSFYKFRSMRVDAQEVLAKMKIEDRARYDSINVMEEPFFKAKEGDDPRITPIGRALRKYSLDELPQFWNVLRGDMSLVGPRPPLPSEVDQLQPWQRRKLSVKGGLTCLWQVSGRNEITDVDEWMRLDLEYIDNWSLWLDVKLLFKTVKVMVKPKGAS